MWSRGHMEEGAWHEVRGWVREKLQEPMVLQTHDWAATTGLWKVGVRDRKTGITEESNDGAGEVQAPALSH